MNIRLKFILLFMSTLLGCGQQQLSGEQLFYNKQYESAYKVFKPAAEAGDAEAQNYLGMIYYMGLLDTRDPAAAEIWFARAAKQKHASAQLNYGMVIEQRAREASEFLQSYQWYYAAYENGNKEAEKRIQHLLKNHRIFHNQRVFAQKQMEAFIDYKKKNAIKKSD